MENTWWERGELADRSIVEVVTSEFPAHPRIGIKPCDAIEIVAAAVGMAFAIEFDDQPLFAAQEIDNKLTKRSLPNELQSGQPTVSKMLPKSSFRRRHRSAQRFCELSRRKPLRRTFVG